MLHSSGMYCLIFVGVAFAVNLPHDTKHSCLALTWSTLCCSDSTLSARRKEREDDDSVDDDDENWGAG